MGKLIVSVCVIFLLVMSIALAIVLSREQKEDLKYCHQGCLEEKRDALSLCKTQSKQCLDSCKQDFNVCIGHIEEVREACLGVCENTYELIANFSINRTQIIEAKRELGSCKRECLMQARESRKNDCNIAPCRMSCSDDKKQCEEFAKGNHSTCWLGCVDYVIIKDYSINDTLTNETEDFGSLELNQTAETNETIEINHTVEINQSIESNETIQINETKINETSSSNNNCEVGGLRTAGCAAI